MTDVPTCSCCGRPTRCTTPGITIAQMQTEYCITWLEGCAARCETYALAYRRGMADMLAIVKEHHDFDIPDAHADSAWKTVEEIYAERLAQLKGSD